MKDVPAAVETVEIQLLLEGVFRVHGYDFRNYAPASLRRRIRHFVRCEGLNTISALQEKVLHDPASMERLLIALSVDVTAMFRDASFFLSCREKIIPWLKTYPTLRIWHAGCSSGEEVYSMAILLAEHGLHQRTRLYATDMNEAVLAEAKDGIYPLDGMKEFTRNYLEAGGMRSFSDYYTAQYDHAVIQSELKRNIVWARHNMVTDGSFNEFHMIICRNVMIYFDRTLQKRVHRLLYDSLITFGILGLGQKESIKFSPYEACYEDVDSIGKWYRKIR